MQKVRKLIIMRRSWKVFLRGRQTCSSSSNSKGGSNPNSPKKKNRIRRIKMETLIKENKKLFFPSCKSSRKKFQHVCHTIFLLSKFTRLNSLPFTSTAGASTAAATLGTFRKSAKIAMQQALHQNPFSTTSKLFFLHLASESRAASVLQDFSFYQKLV